MAGELTTRSSALCGERDANVPCGADIEKVDKLHAKAMFETSAEDARRLALQKRNESTWRKAFEVAKSPPARAFTESVRSSVKNAARCSPI